MWRKIQALQYLTLLIQQQLCLLITVKEMKQYIHCLISLLTVTHVVLHNNSMNFIWTATQVRNADLFFLEDISLDFSCPKIEEKKNYVLFMLLTQFPQNISLYIKVCHQSVIFRSIWKSSLDLLYTHAFLLSFTDVSKSFPISYSLYLP